MLGICQQVAAIPTKRAAPAETHFLERDEIEDLLRRLPRTGRLALRDRALLLFLYNTGARVQEVADLRVGHLELGERGRGPPPRQGRQVANLSTMAPDQQQLLAELLDTSNDTSRRPTRRCSVPRPAKPLTRFGIYKIVRRHAGPPRRRPPRTHE